MLNVLEVYHVNLRAAEVERGQHSDSVGHERSTSRRAAGGETSTGNCKCDLDCERGGARHSEGTCRPVFLQLKFKLHVEVLTLPGYTGILPVGASDGKERAAAPAERCHARAR